MLESMDAQWFSTQGCVAYAEALNYWTGAIPAALISPGGDHTVHHVGIHFDGSFEDSLGRTFDLYEIAERYGLHSFELSIKSHRACVKRLLKENPHAMKEAILAALPLIQEQYIEPEPEFDPGIIYPFISNFYPERKSRE